VATQTQTYYVGLGQTSSMKWVDTLAYETQIDNIAEWTATNNINYMWVVPPTTILGSNGPWYNLENTEKYIGIRYYKSSEWKYGWIKVNGISRNDISLVSFALET